MRDKETNLITIKFYQSSTINITSITSTMISVSHYNNNNNTDATNTNNSIDSLIIIITKTRTITTTTAATIITTREYDDPDFETQSTSVSIWCVLYIHFIHFQLI